MLDNLKELENLSTEEKEEVVKILNQITTEGNSEEYNKFLYEDYEEIPVDIETFLKDEKYLGKGLVNEEGKFTVFSYWLDLLKEIYPDPLKPAKYNTLALTGAIGLGKSFEAVLIGLYELYRMLCLKDPYLHYGLQPIDKITFAVMNITIDASKGVAWDKMQQLLQVSPWFMEHGTVSGTVNIEWAPNNNIELIAGSLSRHIIGRAVFWAFFDEISFQPNIDVERQKEKAKTLVNTASARMQSRFMRGEHNPTILVLASSKRTEQSYMESFIENKKKTESKTTKVVDEPQWVIREDKNSANKFKVAIGNKFLSSEVIPLDATEKDIDLYRDRGFNVIDVPMGYYENFIDDIDIALTDIAGISTTSSSRYISGPRLASVKDDEILNPFSSDILEIGNDPKDTNQYYDFFNFDVIDKSKLQYPLYIHLDMSISGDKTGIAGTWITGKKPPVEGQPPSKELFYQPAFVVSIKAPKGFQISFEKNRQFIYWLKDNGFNIKGISCDTFQSADLLQQLNGKGFETEIISVDRAKDNVCQPYQYLRSTIYEERIKLFKNDLLTEELIGLERNNTNGKIDHAPSGINCFTGDTKVSLLDGRNLTMLELVDEFEAGKSNYVYSFNHNTNKIEPQLIKKAWCSGHDARLVEVTLDNGEAIRCTPEHRFMLRDGSYKEAQDLLENESLMPLYTKLSDKGLESYRLYYEPMEDKWHYEHRQFAIDVLDERYLVHHKDCNKTNNRPDNLIWCSKKKHNEIHSSTNTGPQSEEARQKRKESVTAWHANNKDNPEYWTRYASYKGMAPEEAYEAHIAYEHAMHEQKIISKVVKDARHKHNQDKMTAQKQRQDDMSRFYGVDLNSLEGTQLQALMIKYAHDIDPTYQERVSEAVSQNHKAGKYKNAYIALQKCNENRRSKPRPKEVIDKMKATKAAHGPYEISDETRHKLSESSSKRRWYNNGYKNIYINPEVTEIPYGFVHGRLKTWKNHKVKSIKFLNYTEDVYDLEIEHNHNFAVSSGVFVHNSKDSADALCGSVWNASQHGEEFDFEFGETLDTIVEVSNESTLGNEREQITLDFEEELKKVANSFGNNIPKQSYTDFGLGASTTDYALFDECFII